MLEYFLTAKPEKIKRFTIGDLTLYANRPQRIDRDQHIAAIERDRQLIRSTRMFDVRDVWETAHAAVRESVEASGPYYIDDYASRRVMPADCEPPFLSPPSVGVYGWYQIKEDEAVLIYPPCNEETFVAYTGEAAVTIEGWHHEVVLFGKEPDADGMICVTGGFLAADGEQWNVMWNTFPTLEKDQEQALRYGPVGWEEKLNEDIPSVESSPSNLCTYVMNTATTVLLLNTLVQSDATVLRTERIPVKRARSLEKKGRQVVRVRSWIDLPGLQYQKGTFTAPPPQPGGVAWHRVRGHWRRLQSTRYVHKSGQKVWVRPHSRGHRDMGESNVPYRIH